MIYDLTVSIDYAYGAPSWHARNMLRVMPLNLPGVQRRITGTLAVAPLPEERYERRDFFGNQVVEVAFHRAIAGVSFSLAARVERLAEEMQLDLSPRLGRLAAEVAAWRDLAPGAPHHFLGPGPRTPADAAIAAFARDLAGERATALEVVTAIGRALHREMRFNAGATDVDTAPAAAFQARHGVCQDFSHIMIIALRAVGVPAGYVSGVLRTEPPPGRPRLEGADAMHAWVRAWVGQEMGWIEYDPTNELSAGTDHVAIAHGRDYSDVAPVKGTVRTAAPQGSGHSVDLIPVG